MDYLQITLVHLLYGAVWLGITALVLLACLAVYDAVRGLRGRSHD